MLVGHCVERPSVGEALVGEVEVRRNQGPSREGCEISWRYEWDVLSFLGVDTTKCDRFPVCESRSINSAFKGRLFQPNSCSSAR